MKDDRASAPENHVCVCELVFFFFLAAYARTLQRSDAVQSRTPLSFRKGLFVGGVSWANPVPGANLRLDFGAFQFRPL